MLKRLIFVPPTTPVMRFAAKELALVGCEITDTPCPGMTHLLLPVPCRLDSDRLYQLLDQVNLEVTVLGGFLDRPELSGYKCVDLLKDERYQAENAMITAYCALQTGANALPVIWKDCPVLILGWGRIGKCLSKRLQALDARVSIAARKQTDLAMITALGMEAQPIADLTDALQHCRVIFNTVPCPVLSREQAALCRPDCIMVELASKAGIDADGVIDGRGLPGKLAPESAGKLIAQTVLRLCVLKEEDI